MLKPALTLCAAALALGACATPYRPPSMPPPAVWSGVAGLEPAGAESLSVLEGRKLQGEVVAELPVRFRRTGVIAAPVAYKGAFGGDRTITAGTPVFAAQFTLTMSSYGVMREAQGAIDPIEWCTAPASGESACIFWEAPDRARYMDSYTDRTSPLLYRPLDGSGVTGPVPVIEEGPVTLGPLSRRLVVRRVTERDLELADELFADGQSRRDDIVRRRWDANGRILLELLGVPIRFTRVPAAAGQPPAVTVERLSGQAAP